MELNLNKDLIHTCNNNSQFNSGNILEKEALETYNRFDEIFSRDGLTDKQITFLEDRKLKYKELIEEAYNNMLSNRAKFVPWNVSGRANYPADKMSGIADRNMEKSIEWSGKINRFIENTIKMLDELTPIDIILEDYRNGKWKYGEKISSDDPYAIEKLNAKLEYLEKYHTDMKASNRKARSEGRQAPFPPYMLTNNLATIKSVKKRIEELAAPKEIGGFLFVGGEVVANYEVDRLQIFFDEKPDEEVRKELKSNGFRWAPSQGAWQRKLNTNALYSARKLFEEINKEV